MVRKITKTLLIGAMFLGVACGSQAACAGWSLNPFASDKSQPKTRQTSATKKAPNALEKVGAGTKNFFNKTGETLGLKKPTPKKAPAVVAAKPRTIPAPYQPKKGLLALFSQEKPRDKTVNDWMKHTEQVHP